MGDLEEEGTAVRGNTHPAVGGARVLLQELPKAWVACRAWIEEREEGRWSCRGEQGSDHMRLGGHIERSRGP